MLGGTNLKVNLTGVSCGTPEFVRAKHLLPPGKSVMPKRPYHAKVSVCQKRREKEEYRGVQNCGVQGCKDNWEPLCRSSICSKIYDGTMAKLSGGLRDGQATQHTVALPCDAIVKASKLQAKRVSRSSCEPQDMWKIQSIGATAPHRGTMLARMSD